MEIHKKIKKILIFIITKAVRHNNQCTVGTTLQHIIYSIINFYL